MNKTTKITVDAFNKLPNLGLQFFSENSEGSNGQVDNPNEENNQDSQVGREGDKQEKTFTQEEVNKMIKNRLKNTYSKEDVENMINEKLNESEKLKNMNEKQKSDYEKSQLQKELEELKAEKVRFGLEKEATSMLAEHNIVADEPILSFVVGKDAETTKERVESFTNLVDEIVNSKVKEALRQENPFGNGNNKTKTFAERLAEEKNNKKEVQGFNPWAR